MSTDVNAERIKQIERDLAEKREELQFHKNNLETMRGDEGMIDAATRENGRINNLSAEIDELEADLRRLKS